MVSYFIGDNLTELVSHYDIEAARGASAIFFVIALMVFWITSPLSHLIRETHLTSFHKKPTQRKRHWCNAIDTITIILKVDVLYSAVLVMVDTSDNVCESANIYLLFLACILMGTAYVFIKILVLWYDKNPVINYKCRVIVIFIAIIGLVSFPLHTLMDNKLPLDCGFQCSDDISMPAMDGSFPDLSLCSVQRANNAGIRFSLTLINLLVLTFFSLLFGSAYLMKRFKEENFKKLMPMNCSCTSTARESTQNEGNCFILLYYRMSRLSLLIVDTN